MSARLLIIGLEATDLSLVQRHIGERRLPAISALRVHGRLKTLAASARATDAALWASFQYASEIGEHGRYHDILRLESGRFGLAVQDEQEREAIWDELSRHGMRVAVFDLPKSRAPRPIYGIHLTDWLVHGRTFPRPLSYPARLAEEMVNRFGEAPPSRCDRTCEELTDAQIVETLGHLQNSVSMKRAAALFYLGRERWDCFLVNFKEMHCCSHGYWNLIDTGHPAHDRARALRLGGSVCRASPGHRPRDRRSCRCRGPNLRGDRIFHVGFSSEWIGIPSAAENRPTTEQVQSEPRCRVARAQADLGRENVAVW